MRQRDEARLKLKAKRDLERKHSSRKSLCIVIDWEEVKKNLRYGLSGAQIANIMGFSDETLYERCIVDNGEEWSRYKRKYTDIGVKEILKTQHEIAIEDRDRGMLIWLGKCRAGQVDMGLAPRSDNEKQVSDLLTAVLKFAAQD
jgi:hypothetical protein